MEKNAAIQELIGAGKTDDEIVAVLVRETGVSEATALEVVAQERGVDISDVSS